MKIPALLLFAIVAAGHVAVADIAPQSLPLAAAPGSLAPRLSASADGTLVLSWLEPANGGHALRHARWRGDGWTSPRTAAAGADWFANWADLPAVTPIDGDFWVAHWLKRRPAGGYAYDIVVAVSNNAGDSFGEPFHPHDDDTDTEHGFVSFYRHADGAGLVWLDGRQTADGGAMTLRSAVVTRSGAVRDPVVIDERICDCCATSAVSVGDGALVAYRDRSAAEIRDISVATRDGNGWSAPQALAIDSWEIHGCPVNGPALAASADERAVAWFTAAGGNPRVRFARVTGDGAFGDALDLVSGNTVGRTGLALLDDGRAAVTSLVPDGGGLGKLVLSLVSPAGTAAPPLPIADGLPVMSVPQLARAGDALLLAWIESVDGQRQLRTGHLPLAALERVPGHAPGVVK